MSITVPIVGITIGAEPTRKEPDHSAERKTIDRMQVKKTFGVTDEDIDARMFGFPTCMWMPPRTGEYTGRQVWNERLVERWRDDLKAFAARLK